MPDVYHVKGLKHNLLSIVQLIQKGYRVYMEDNHCVIKDILPRNRLIENVPMESNYMFPWRIRIDMKAKTTQVVHEGNNENSGTTFKEENKEEDKYRDKK